MHTHKHTHIYICVYVCVCVPNPYAKERLRYKVMESATRVQILIETVYVSLRANGLSQEIDSCLEKDMNRSLFIPTVNSGQTGLLTLAEATTLGEGKF